MKMDRREFIKTAVMAAIASRFPRNVFADDPNLRLGWYDNFDGVGCLQSNGTYLAQEGAFSSQLWQFYRGIPTIVDIDGKVHKLYKAVDKNGIEITPSAPGIDVLTEYLSGEEYYG